MTQSAAAADHLFPILRVKMSFYTCYTMMVILSGAFLLIGMCTVRFVHCGTMILGDCVTFFSYGIVALLQHKYTRIKVTGCLSAFLFAEKNLADR